MKHRAPISLVSLCVVLLFAAATRAGDVVTQVEQVSVRKIWDAGPHNAFTSLVRFNGAWFCAFREGKGHVSPDGAARVLTSADGETWASAARLTNPAADLRDPKLCITPDNRLMLTCAGATPKEEVR